MPTRNNEERDFRLWPREKWNDSQKMKEAGGEASPPPRFFTRTIFRAVFDSRSSFFAPKPRGNDSYVGYQRLMLGAPIKLAIMGHFWDSSKTSHVQNEAKCKTLLVKISVTVNSL